MFGQASSAVDSLDPIQDGDLSVTPLRRKGKNYTPHQRMILKAQALFPGCEIVSHRDGKEAQG